MKEIKGLLPTDKRELIDILEAANPDAKTRIGEIRLIDKICTILEQDGEIAAFEDADYQFFKQRVESFPGWIGKSRKEILRIADILGFV